MKNETKNGNGEALLAEAAENLRTLTKKLNAEAIARAKLMLGCVTVLLAERHSLVDDLVEHLKDAEGILIDRILDLYKASGDIVQIESLADARDELLDIIRELPHEKQTSICKDFAQQIKSRETVAATVQ